MNPKGFGTAGGVPSIAVTFSPDIKNTVQPAKETFAGRRTASVAIQFLSPGPLLATSVLDLFPAGSRGNQYSAGATVTKPSTHYGRLMVVTVSIHPRPAARTACTASVVTGP